MQKIFAFGVLSSLFAFASIFLLPIKVLAVCPVCTVAVAAGVGLSRYLGIDDLVSGVWVGGLILSFSFWVSSWFKKRVNFLAPDIISVLVVFSFVMIPMWMGGLIGHPFNKIWGIDRLVFGVVSGALIFLLAVRLDKLVRKMKGKQLLPYQKVIFPLVALVLLSGLFFGISKI